MLSIFFIIAALGALAVLQVRILLRLDRLEADSRRGDCRCRACGEVASVTTR